MKCQTIYLKYFFAATGTIYYVAIAKQHVRCYFHV